MSARADQLAANLSEVVRRLERACRDAGRDPGEVNLVVVTKYFPASDVRILADLGVGAVAESRHQEAAEKVAECADLGLTWHFIGNLQSNKAGAVAGYADVVESVDRVKLIPGLNRGAHGRGQEVICLVQVSLDPDPGAGAARPATGAIKGGRGGAVEAEIETVATAIQRAGALTLGGVMAVAPLGEPPGPAFARLAHLADVVRAVQPSATRVSAGMSGDFEEAVKHGATHVRIGSAVLGPRPTIK